MKATVIKAGGNLDGALGDVASRIFNVCRAKKNDEPLVLGLCGGRSVVGLLSALQRESKNQPKDVLERINFFMVDERLVPLTDDQSNFGGLKRLLFDSLVRQGVIAEQQLHPFQMEGSKGDYGCSAYRKELEQAGGRFTVVVLGVGEDGHIAGLFPHHATLKASEATFSHFHDSPKLPLSRMTATPALVATADLSILLVIGEGKRAAWKSFKDPAISEAACPAKLALKAKSCLVVTDLE